MADEALESHSSPMEAAIASIEKFGKVEGSTKDLSIYTSLAHQRLPRPSKRRQSESLSETPFDLESPANTPLHEFGGGPESPKTVFYLAYGSNLCRETFQGRRGIKPLSAVNVVVPELVMTFDLAGIPYAEPCFANTRYRSSNPTITLSTPLTPTPVDDQFPEYPASTPLIDDSPTTILQKNKKNYHKCNWHKGLVGVVYEVTLSDFAHIIATEGGGASYQDVLVDCYELAPGSSTVPEYPTVQPFKAHTLYSPITPYNSSRKTPRNQNKKKRNGRFSRPDPDYAQPSARYIKLITDGADEHDIPQEYKNYLHQLRPYTITTLRQRIGGSIFMTLWFPVIMTLFGLNRQFADEKGRAPEWLVRLMGVVFQGVWVSYDYLFKYFFGEGERTIGQEEDDEEAGYVKEMGMEKHGAAI